MKEKEMIRLVRVRFPSEMQPGVFLVGDLPLEYGQRVVAMSERGLAVGFINSQVYEEEYHKEMGELLHIKRIASDEDLIKYKADYQKQREAAEVFKQLVKEHELPINLEDMEYVSQGRKVVFHYTAPTRVDFRALLKSLVSKLKVRIELKQIFDDENKTAKIGPCGPDLCLFINSVSNKSAKFKGCSETHCCLENNDRFYDDKRSRLPKMRALVSTHTGELGKVQQLDLVKEEFEILTDKGIVKRYVSEMYKETLNKKATPFPDKFEFISFENKVVIGLEKRLEKKERLREIETTASTKAAKEFSEEVWKSIVEAD